ncbi:MAG TPA: hypothetical protein VJ227_04885 [Patescibacteria group bacterium]|nr:hypothetical protein [Patescibacteria group bacterium]
MSKAKDTIKVIEPPKIPTLNFGKPSFSPTGQRVSGPKGKIQTKFNQSTFHTQHKGGPSGGK